MALGETVIFWVVLPILVLLWALNKSRFIKPEYKKAAMLGAVLFFVTGFLMVNPIISRFNAGLIYTIITGFSVVIYIAASSLGLVALAGIRPDLRGQIFEGAVYGLGFISLNFITKGAITLGVPKVALSASAGDFFVAGVVAPSSEELFFRGVLLALLLMIFKRDIIAVGLTSFGFAIYHLLVYGLAMSAAFLGAGLFSVIACIIVIKRKSIVQGIVMHMFFNNYLLFSMAIAGAKYALK